MPTTDSPRSTSTTELRPSDPAPARQRVRRKIAVDEALILVPAPKPMAVLLRGGGTRSVTPKDFLVTTADGAVIDVVRKSDAAEFFEPIPDTPPITLTVPQIARLGTALALGATTSPEALVDAVERLSRMRVAGVDLPLSEGQKAELVRRAQKRGLPEAVYVQQLLDRFLADVWGVGVGPV